MKKSFINQGGWGENMKKYSFKKRFCLILASVFLGVAILASIIAPAMSVTLNSFAGGVSGTASKKEREATAKQAELLAEQIEAEGILLLRNENDTLPLSEDTKKVNLFGWASVDWLGGGSGSGGVSRVDVDLLDALENYGIETNSAITKMYRDFQSGREYVRTLNSWPEESCRLYEPSVSDKNYYSDKLLSEAKEFSDTAIVVLGRISGESNDATQKQYKRLTKGGEIIVDDSRTYLDLSTEEEDLLRYVGENYEKVVVILNTANLMTLGALERIDGIDSCIMAGFSGQSGAIAIPKILYGEENPSGHTADTWAYAFDSAPSYANAAAAGVGKYTNAEGLYPADGTSTGNGSSPYKYDQVSYVDYSEGIYIGYKWYETADAEGYFDSVSNEYGEGYEGVVQYPFGYGLSYTDFSWEITEHSSKMDKNGSVDVKVRVTNIGKTAGKDVVQLYYTSPYTVGEIEKSALELGAFAKTSVLNPGESQELLLSVPVYDMASYDCYDRNGNGFKGYELDSGEYIFSLRYDAHSIVDSFGISLTEGIKYEVDPVSGLRVGNKFTGEDAIDGVSLDGSDSEQNIPYLTRADFEGTFPRFNVSEREMSENIKELNLYTEELANGWIDESDSPIVTGAKGDIRVMEKNRLTDIGYQLGSDYYHPMWEQALDQLTVKEMLELTVHGYGHTARLKSIGKDQTLDADGPAQIGGFTGMNAGTGFPSSSTLAQTWNAELALLEGRIIGHQAAQNGYSGWYAPAVNMHRSPFNGRNYEYYSEDSLLSGVLCGNTVAGALDAGVFCYVKHLICNDGEAGIFRDSVYIWMSEQTLREIYLEPFRIIVEKYGATGIMSSYNRISAVWTGGSEALLTGILREEWGFCGAVITDYSDHHSFMNGDQMLRAGGDLWMDGVVSGRLAMETESNSFMQALRRASKNMIYMQLNALAHNIDYVEQSGDTDMIRPLIATHIPLWQILLILIDLAAIILFFAALSPFINYKEVVNKCKNVIRSIRAKRCQNSRPFDKM